MKNSLRVVWIMSLLYVIFLAIFLTACGGGGGGDSDSSGDDWKSPSSTSEVSGSGIVRSANDPDLSVNYHALWDRGAGRDLVWASVSLKDDSGDWVTGRNLDDFELTETLLDSANQVVDQAIIDFQDSAYTSYQFDGSGFWERTVTEEKLDILFIIDRSGTMDDEMPEIRDELHEFLDHLQAQHIDFGVAGLEDEWIPGWHSVFPSDENVPFPFAGVMQAAEIRDWIDGLGTVGEWWEPNTGYDSLMGATEFEWRSDPEVRKRSSC